MGRLALSFVDPVDHFVADHLLCFGYFGFCYFGCHLVVHFVLGLYFVLVDRHQTLDLDFLAVFLIALEELYCFLHRLSLAQALKLHCRRLLLRQIFVILLKYYLGYRRHQRCSLVEMPPRLVRNLRLCKKNFLATMGF